jgi:hypothetical protein
MMKWITDFFKRDKSVDEQSPINMRLNTLPKATDYPKSKFKAHWEIVRQPEHSTVRLYSNTGKLLTYSNFENKGGSVDSKISEWVKLKMEDHKV